MTTTLSIVRSSTAAVIAALAVVLMCPSLSAGAEAFQVEVIRGATVLRVSGDADGILSEVVTRADPNPPKPKIKVERPPAPPETVILVVRSDPPRYRDRQIIVHSSFARPHHLHSVNRTHSDHHGRFGHHAAPRRDSSLRGGVTRGVWH